MPGGCTPRCIFGGPARAAGREESPVAAGFFAADGPGGVIVGQNGKRGCIMG
jgi:hypothetical protein